MLSNRINSKFIFKRFFSVADTKSSEDFFKNIPKYKSNLSLDNLHKNSQLNINKKVDLPKKDGFSGYIPMNKINMSFCRSSGPGGQNLHKTNSKVVVSIHLKTADWIPENTRNKLQEIHKNSISKEGNWIIRSDKTRSQHLNIADCMDKIRCFICEAEKPPKMPSFESLEQIRLGIEKAAAIRLRKKRDASAKRNMCKFDHSE